jgi:glutathione S-transferase
MEWLELYQAEWCPHSRRVRQRLTELGIDFVSRQVPAETADRKAMRERTGLDEIPVLVLTDGEVVAGEKSILTQLDARFARRERRRWVTGTRNPTRKQPRTSTPNE